MYVASVARHRLSTLAVAALRRRRASGGGRASGMPARLVEPGPESGRGVVFFIADMVTFCGLLLICGRRLHIPSTRTT